MYSAFIEKIWQTVDIRLLAVFLETLKAGKEVRVGSLVSNKKRWGYAADTQTLGGRRGRPMRVASRANMECRRFILYIGVKTTKRCGLLFPT